MQTPQNDAGETMTSVDETLEQRGARYGAFEKNAAVAQTLKAVMLQTLAENPAAKGQLPPYIREAIELICHKLSRIACGDPFYDDSWHDISGYSKLVVDILQKGH